MNQDQWTLVENYVDSLLLPEDPALAAALDASAAAGLPAYQVSPSQGKLLALLAHLQQARKILEIGTLGGYSTIWLARTLPADGRLITLEVNPTHAEVARTNITRAALNDLVEFRLGKALETLPQLVVEGQGPFDLIFIDADKPNNPGYFRWALKLARQGTLIIVDNIIRAGAVADENSDDPDVVGARLCLEAISNDSRVSATVLQTVGSKGYDGFVLAVVSA